MTTTTAVEKSADNVVSPEANKEQPNDLDVQKEDAHKAAWPKTKTQAGEGSKLETKKVPVVPSGASYMV